MRPPDARTMRPGHDPAFRMHLTPAFQSLSPAARRGLWLASVAAAVAYSVFLRDQGAPLLEWMTRGIVTLELPGDPETAQRLIDALGERGRAVATVQVQLDFVFLLLYPLAFSTSAALLATQVRGLVSRACDVTARLVWLAAPLDAIENLAILKMLAGYTATPWPQLSTACAAVKFAIVGIAALALVAGLLAWAARRAVRKD